MELALTVFLILAAIYITGKLIALPIKLALKLMLNGLAGAILLMTFNFLGSYIGIGINITLFNAVLSGILGIPGVLVLVIFKLL